MSYTDLWGFTSDHLYLGYDSSGQEKLVLRIFHYHGPTRSQIELGFRGRKYFIIISSWSNGPHLEGLEAQKSIGGAPSKGGRTTLPLFIVDRLFHLILSPTNSVLSKNPYIYDP
jgi:hypothetical protein